MARNFKKEYANYQGSEEQKKNRAARNKARRQAIKDGRAKKGDGKDVDHIDGNPRNNKKSNHRVVSKRTNRSFSRKGKSSSEQH